jgi:hypothetical protein
MKVLVYCPLVPNHDGRKRIHPLTLESIMALEADDRTAIVFDRQDNPPDWDPYMNIAKKYTTARHMALDGGYDALLTVEADMIVPPDALQRLQAIDTDVAYGLYASRHEQLAVWLAFAWTKGLRGKSLSLIPDKARAAWGNVVETHGVGLGCTLIRRHVLEAVPFRWTMLVPTANDWLFSLDLKEKGFRQMHDCGLHCGHVTTDGTGVIWPDITQDKFFRVEAIGA